MSETDPVSQPLDLFVQPAASEDLRRQMTYLQQQATTETARRFLHAARNSMGDLTLMPGMGTTVENSIIPDLRRWRVKGFEKILIFYRFDATAVYVIRVLHGMRDIDSILNDERED